VSINNIQESPRQDGSSNPAVDLFLSYNSQDRAAVQQVRTLLESREVSVFYDRESLNLGLNWFEPLERALGWVRGVVVLLGPNGLGRWQRREMALALDRQTREATSPSSPSSYLRVRWAITAASCCWTPTPTFGADWMPPTRWTPLCGPCEITRRAEGSHSLTPQGDPDLPRHKLLACQLVVVVGASGSSKSSSVRAGPLPRLRREPTVAGTWDVVTFLPGRILSSAWRLSSNEP